MRRPWGGLLALVATGAALSGCFNPFRPAVTTDPSTIPVSTAPAPQPTSPRNVMKLFKWCWEHQDIRRYREVFTEDFRFVFAEADSEGNRLPNRAYTREDELISAEHLFVGGLAHEPPANSITLDFRSILIPEEDTRPGKKKPYHYKFQSEVDITIRTDEQTFRILSKAAFYVVRGDTALIPLELRDRGFRKDRGRWYIERYEEIGESQVVVGPPEAGPEAVAGPGAGRPARRPAAVPFPERAVTWGAAKNRWRS